MKLKPGCFLHYLCLDEQYCLLSVRNTVALAWYFQCLDFHGKKALNNLQFYCILRYLTDLDKSQIMLLFDLLDRNARGSIRFKDFYITACILLAHESHMERQFIHQHSSTAFQLLDVDGNGLITTQELQDTQFLFSFQKKELKKIFKEFDVSGD
ncbi:EFCB9 protein, partial [Penelope pileata]|nr:EFCB9 protein [Penelope pileata]